MKHGVKFSLIALALASTGFAAQAEDSVVVEQSGNNNTANYNSLGGNAAEMIQRGNDNTIATGQFTGSGNTAGIGQLGDHNSVSLNETSTTTGSGSDYFLIQFGAEGVDQAQGQQMNIDIDGGNNDVTAYQFAGDGMNADGSAGTGNQLNVQATGEGNVLTSSQSGDTNLIDINSGSLNTNVIGVTQAGDNNTLDMNEVTNIGGSEFEVSQGGNNNLADFSDVARIDGSSMAVFQEGQGNQTNFTSIADVNDSRITADQVGDGNTINFSEVTGVDSSTLEAYQQGNSNTVNFASATNLTDSVVTAEQMGNSNSISGSLSGLNNTTVTSFQGSEEDAEPSTNNQVTFAIRDASNSEFATEQLGKDNTIDVDIISADEVTYNLTQDGEGNRIDYASSWFSSNIDLTVDQTGKTNVTYVYADGRDTTVDMIQTGESNRGVVRSSASGSDLDTVQNGGFNNLDLLIGGDDMTARLVQLGYRNTLTGDDGSLSVSGSGHTLDLVQNGDDNVHTSDVAGNGNTLDTWQLGDENQLTSSQSGDGLIAYGYQIGDSNELSVTQTGENNESYVLQIGTDNSAIVTQAGFGNFADVSQGGIGNSATISQMKP
ncbi:hypothetical protein [Ferrimonas sp. YFM]|uniref:beta strand repeat-containing protein n=1 Tax=Ferrimonas sp. YFM TaxID=3028878 RepID=UPI002574572B|nr:hypothetical protein [Ferrimonas sp. YFM]